MGTDIRKAVLDGFPADYAVGADLFPAFIEAGYKLWQDKDTCRIKFVQGDIFKLPPTPIAPSTVPLTSVAALEQLGGKVNYLYTGSVFHLFDEPEQAEMALRVAIISARQPGSIIFGRHRGAEVKGFSQSMRTDKESFGHSPATWKELWTETLTKIESAEFVQDHVVLAAELLEVEVVSNYKRRVLQWSVRFV
ncbi:hypothetical protein DL93DRAFT_2073051 [Clavulina sp. PMI_390]|nr:hypothetical protein DL93DRAFT_2073051 [Clavulina sp. PMI_390]